MKINKIMLVIVSLIVVTSSAFLLSNSDDSSGAEIQFGNLSTEFTFVYDDSDSLHLVGALYKEVTLKSYNWNSDSVTIPDFIYEEYPAASGIMERFNVTVIGPNAFNQKENLRTISMGENVMVIQDAAFRECVNLGRGGSGPVEVDLKNVREVGYQAFMHCTSLEILKAEHLVKIGNYAFAILDVINLTPYTGPIPYMEVLNLPMVEEIGQGAFGAQFNNSLARDFGTVRIPNVVTVGAYAFSESVIDDQSELDLSKATTIGDNAFFLTLASYSDASDDYSLLLNSVTSIGRNAFTGRAIADITFPASAGYTIGDYAFMYTTLKKAELGNVTSIGVSAFDGTHELEYFLVPITNTHYASIISKEIGPGDRGVHGALYSLSGGNPNVLIKLPSGIKPLLADRGNKFVVADGVKVIERSAFDRCPSILVDLNDVEEIPNAAFAGSDVLAVYAENVKEIGTSAFTNCAALRDFRFLTTGDPLVIGDDAFLGTSLITITLPEKTTIGKWSFSRLTNAVEEVSVWAEATVASNAFEYTRIQALRIVSDSTCIAEANNIYNNWNSWNWEYNGSYPTGLLIIDNISGTVDISNLIPKSMGNIQIMNWNHTSGALQFVEYKPISDRHIMSVKTGIYTSETHSPAVLIQNGVNDPTTVPGRTCEAGDNKTWELVDEYYTINFYSFDTDADTTGDGMPDGENENYINPLLGSLDVADRTLISSEKYLSGNDLKSLLYQTYVRYSLDGWYIADDPIHGNAVLIDRNNVVRASDAFGRTIPDSWIDRDPVTDVGELNLYAIFSGKVYEVILEARLTVGMALSSAGDNVPTPVGGTVYLDLPTPIHGSTGFNTGTVPTGTGSGSDSYPFGTTATLRAVPNTGYAFVGWSVYRIDDDVNPVVFERKDDRSLIQSHGTATWNITLSSQLKYVAYFARVNDVVFDPNDGSSTKTVTYVVGDRILETDNAYNGHDYDALLNGDPEPAPFNVKGTAYYYPPTGTGTPLKTTLTFGGWYNGTTPYAEYDDTDSVFTGSYLKNFNSTGIPTTPMPLELTAKWYATITFYPNGGNITGATLTGAGVTDMGGGVYTYQHDVGKWDGVSNYDRKFDYGAVYSPTISDVNFNGWYILSGGTTITDILSIVAPDANATSPYPNVYDTKKRLEPNTAIKEHTSLMALYVAEVEFYFNTANNATDVDPMITTHPYKITVPASVTTTFGDTYFGIINSAIASANTFKKDALGADMVFMGWYESADGITLPVAADGPPKANSDVISKNVKLIAGWGYTVALSDGGAAPGDIIDNATGTTWVPGPPFNVLEGTVFDMADMPDLETPFGKPVTAWYDPNATPHKWYTTSVLYTYSLTLVPEFRDLFEFNMMGGDQGIIL
ncbi:MAG: leucine-rich repeat protein, partial [Methanomassiliicoccaceae archaeon]|nr:leucine-rich repeat protein [Methanomassiliicoccaceae archaeon]